jgi:hypothetical protein
MTSFFESALCANKATRQRRDSNVLPHCHGDDVDRHGVEFRHCDRWRPDTLDHSAAQRQFRLGARGGVSAVFEREFAADPPANTLSLWSRLYMNNGATAAPVAYDCSGV